MSNLAENMLPRFGQNADGSQDVVVSSRNSVITELLSVGSAATGTTQVASWPCAGMSKKALQVVCTGVTATPTVTGTLYAVVDGVEVAVVTRDASGTLTPVTLFVWSPTGADSFNLSLDDWDGNVLIVKMAVTGAGAAVAGLRVVSTGVI